MIRGKREFVILVLGIGNPLLADDGVGIHLLDRLKGIKGIETRECNSSLDLFEAVEREYDHVFIVDAVITGQEPGTIYEVSLRPDTGVNMDNSKRGKNSLKKRFGGNSELNTDTFPKVLSHDLDLDVLIPYSDKITILAVEAKDITSFSENCTPEVERSISEMLNIIIERSNRIL